MSAEVIHPAPTPQGFRLKPVHMVGLVIVVAAVIMGYFGLRDAIRPYTESVDEAMASNRTVQLAGFLGSKGGYNAENNFTFKLQDETGQMVTVVSEEPMPSNFDHATSVVAIGHYDEANGVFLAEDLLVKCPSKYQEQAGGTAGM
ncbi:MAG: cytochrome c maturation protein CcmE [Chloroflexota bacterium]